MKITVNSELHDVAGGTLSLVLDELGYAGAVVATAVNGSFVPVKLRQNTPLKTGDAIEVLAPMQGG